MIKLHKKLFRFLKIRLVKLTLFALKIEIVKLIIAYKIILTYQVKNYQNLYLI